MAETKNKNAESKMDPMLRLVQQVSKKFLDVDERLTSIVHANIQAIVKAGLGLKEEHWSRREIGLYETNGFKSELHSLIEAIVQRDVTANAKKVFDQIFADKKFQKDFIKSFEQRFEGAYSAALGRRLGELVTQAANEAEQDFKEECKTLSKAMDGTLAPIVAAARAKVLADLAAKKEAGSNVGNHESTF